MAGRYCIDGIVKKQEHIDSEIVDSPYGHKMVVPIFNSAVPAYYQDFALKAAGMFMAAYSAMCGRPVEAEDIYLDGHLGAYLDRKIPLDKKYRLFITVIMGQGSNVESEDYVMEIKVLPTDAHFGEFRQCLVEELGKMLGGQR